jgi:tetratricopeptide (TPR) repeat protein
MARTDADSALVLIDRVLVAAQALQDERLVGNALYQFGMVHYLREEYDRAVELYLQAIPMLSASGDSLPLSYAHNRLGNAYRRLGRIAESHASFRESVRFMEERNDLVGAAYAHTNLGLLHWRTGEYEKALPHYLSSLEIRRQLGDRWRTASTLNNIGILYFNWANLVLAEKNAELEQAQDKVQTLSGLLPICAQCKKIRDDQGFWEQLETYIHKHSAAEFSHGICPDCAHQLYPEYMDDIEQAPKPPES